MVSSPPGIAVDISALWPTQRSQSRTKASGFAAAGTVQHSQPSCHIRRCQRSWLEPGSAPTAAAAFWLPGAGRTQGNAVPGCS